MHVRISGNMGLVRHTRGDARAFKVNESPVLYVKDEELGLEEFHELTDLARTDGASVPRAFWWYASPLSGLHAPAALFHDIYYATHILPKEVADLIFYHGMLDLGVRKAKAWAMYQSVKVGGRKAYEDRKDTMPILYPYNYITACRIPQEDTD